MRDRILLAAVVAVAGVVAGVALQNLVIYATSREPLLVGLSNLQMQGLAAVAVAVMALAGYALVRAQP